jgi:ribonuclease D
MPPLPETIVTEPAQLAAGCQEIAASQQIGFDTEFVGEDTYRPELCLIQVATPQHLYVIDPLTAGPLKPFWKIIADPARLVVVHAGREEVRMCHFAVGSPPGNVFDVQVAAGLVGLGYPLGYGPLLQQLLGVRLAKGETLTDWRKRPLSDEQVRYAFDDVRHLLGMGQRLTRRLEELNRLAWAREEFETFTRRAIRENPAAEKWRKLRGVGGLDRRQLAVAREVFMWREECAVRTNRPSRALLRDDLIVEIARRAPQRERDLSSIRGLGRADHAAILAAVARAKALPPDQWPEEFERDYDPPQINLVASLLGVVLADLCLRRKLTTPLVATSHDLKGLVRARAQGGGAPAESPLARGWRREHILPELMGVLEGNVALRVGDLAAEAPLERLPPSARDGPAGEGGDPIQGGP